MKYKYTCLFILVVFAFVISTCKKEAPPCTANCESVNANGIVVNELTTTSVVGVPVSLSWVKFVGEFTQSLVIETVNLKPMVLSISHQTLILLRINKDKGNCSGTLSLFKLKARAA